MIEDNLTRDEQLRVWAIECALDLFRGRNVEPTEIISAANLMKRWVAPQPGDAQAKDAA